MKKSFFTMSMAVVAAVFLLSACGGGGDSGPVDEGSPGAEVPIAESTPRSSTVGSYGDSFYTFTATKTSNYTIGVTNTGSNLSWSLWDSTYSSNYGFCDNVKSGAGDEICFTSLLTAGVTYYLVVSEWDYIAGYYTLTVTP